MPFATPGAIDRPSRDPSTCCARLNARTLQQTYWRSAAAADAGVQRVHRAVPLSSTSEATLLHSLFRALHTSVVSICLALSAWTGVAHAGDIEDGMRRYLEKDFAAALEPLRKAAESGNPVAWELLGEMYFRGAGVERNFQAAFLWHLRAGVRGNARAQCALGVHYIGGYGVGRDDQQAATWFRKAAQQGNALAQMNLGDMYHAGVGVKQDYAQALSWYLKAAGQLSANGGDAPGVVGAQIRLGEIYAEGEGVAQDVVEAYKWISVAAATGLDLAKARGTALEARMTAQQVAKAQVLAADWSKARRAGSPDASRIETWQASVELR